MKEKLIISLDPSTTCTGYSIMSQNSKKLIDCGAITPKGIKGISKMKYPMSSLKKMQLIGDEIAKLLEEYGDSIEKIVVEEIIKGGKSGIKQTKVLSGLHFVILDRIEEYGHLIHYKTPSEWRKILGLKLSADDRLINQAAKKDKTISKITWKDLALRYIIKKYPEFDFKESDHDGAEAVCIGLSYLK